MRRQSLLLDSLLAIVGKGVLPFFPGGLSPSATTRLNRESSGGGELFNILLKPGIALKTQLVAHLLSAGCCLNTDFSCVGEQLYSARCKIVSKSNNKEVVSSPVCEAARKKDAEREAIKALLVEHFNVPPLILHQMD
jgi:hypothetical protein